MLKKKQRYVDRIKTGNAIYEVIKNSNYTQVQLAHIMNVSPVAVSRWATGRHIPDMDSLVHLADTLNVSLDSLIVRG